MLSSPKKIRVGGDLYLVYQDEEGHVVTIVMYEGGVATVGQVMKFEDLSEQAKARIEEVILDDSY